MNIKKILFTVLLAAGCFTASAQQPEYKNAFKPHWFLQAQGGVQYNLGEIDFGNLVTPNVQLAAGYEFTPALALRLSVNGWQSRAGSDIFDQLYKWKWYMVSPTVDLKCDFVNLIGGYKPRLVNAGLLAGVGANIGWHNNDAVAVNDLIEGKFARLQFLWDGTKVRFVGRVGAFVDFNISKRVALGIELNANTLSDHYNSKNGKNTDWYFNGLAGVKINLGKAHKKVLVEKEPCGEVIVEKIVEKPVEKIVEKIVYRDREVAKRESLRRDIFFNIRGSEISEAEMKKVQEIADYLNKYPEAKVTITGYADKSTGNPTLNANYALKRAQKVADVLTKKFNIAAGRVVVDSKGDTVQPYQENDKNRVSICIAE